VLVVTRFAVPVTDGEDFADRAEQALRAFAGCPGFVRGSLGRAADDATVWLLVTEWDGVGAYRRALSSYQVKLAATPLMALAEQVPGAFEVLREVAAGGEVTVRVADRAPDADHAAVGGTARRSTGTTGYDPGGPA